MYVYLLHINFYVAVVVCSFFTELCLTSRGMSIIMVPIQNKVSSAPSLPAITCKHD